MIAVVFVPIVNVELFVTQCLTYCSAQGYQVAGIIRGDWGNAADMLRRGLASVIVVARAEHLDPNREPRVEIVEHARRSPVTEGRRTQLRRRNAAG
ncbi:MAG: hypothetical protein QOH97_1293 [Actinoplanes sp.]|jgi:hypothetical protein|nr:hypothetical protein [Actinoplanes sp.]